MGINFAALPTDSGSGMKPGFYHAKVVKAIMKTPKSGGNDYMELTYELFDINGNKKGKMFDRFFDSDAQPIQYKFGRLNYAAELNLMADIELPDLCKLVPGKEYVVKTKEQVGEDKKPNGFLEADLFDGKIFYRLDEFAELMDEVPDSEVPFETTEPTNTGTY